SSPVSRGEDAVPVNTCRETVRLVSSGQMSNASQSARTLECRWLPTFWRMRSVRWIGAPDVAEGLLPSQPQTLLEKGLNQTRVQPGRRFRPSETTCEIPVPLVWPARRESRYFAIKCIQFLRPFSSRPNPAHRRECSFGRSVFPALHLGSV